MVTIKRKLVLLALAVVLALSSCTNPWMASILNGKEKSSRPNPRAVSVADSINSYGYGGLNASVDGSVVTVTGGVNNPDSSLQLNIPFGVTVRLSGNIGNTNRGNNLNLVELSGSGILEITTTGSIVGDINNDGSAGTGILITGGNPTLKISAGYVVSSGGSAIKVDGGDPIIIISGGTLTTYWAAPVIALNNCGGTITVSGTPTFQGNFTQRIYRDSTATIIGYYSNNTTKAYFDGGWTDQNLFQR
jgi:hypothetical protein